MFTLTIHTGTENRYREYNNSIFFSIFFLLLISYNQTSENIVGVREELSHIDVAMVFFFFKLVYILRSPAVRVKNTEFVGF